MRRTMIPILALLLVLPAALRADQASFVVDLDEAVEAPEAWSQEDPADSLYRAAREAMNRGEHERAARTFHRIWDGYPRSSYAPDAPYWEAYNRYRLDETEELEKARELLALQAERYADASTLKNGDARALNARIAGLLARRGDASAAQSIVVAANEIAGMGARIGAEVAERMEIVAQEMAAQGEIMGQRMAVVAEGVAMGLSSLRSDEIPEHCREQAETQLAALNGLLHMNAERALPVLERVMKRRDDCSLPLRRRAVFLIADKQSPRTVDILLNVARTDPDIEVRRQAVFWLSEVDDPRAVEALESYLDEAQDEKIRERAIFALSQHESPRARQALRRAARDTRMPTRLRGKAIFWLGTEGSAEDVALLKELFGTLNDRDLDKQILMAVGQAEDGSNARWLLSVAGNRDIAPELRRTAIFWAAEAGAPASELGALYDRVADRELKERILFGLSQSPQPAAIDKLIEIARTERNVELRKRAIFWLANSNDPRAADVLMELLDAPAGGSR